MSGWILLVIGVVLGAVGAWLAANSMSKGILAEVRSRAEDLQRGLHGKEQELSTLRQKAEEDGRQKVRVETELKQARLSLDEQKRLLDDAKRNLSDTFGSLAGEALQKNSAEFLRLATTKFETLQGDAKGDLEKRQQAIDALVSPLKESLGKYEKQIQELESARQGAYGRLNQQVAELQTLTGNLNIALRGSHTKVRGRWGELTLHRVAELAGMSEHCDFFEQESFATDAGRQRPDMIVNLPGDRRLPVDSKVPLEAFLGAASAVTEDERKDQLARHSRLVRQHVDRLAKQNYPELMNCAPDLVIMFLPGESFLSAALEQDGSLLEEAMQKRVMLATPTILVSLLLAVHHGWQQQELAASAAEIKALGKVLYDRMSIASEHMEKIGQALAKAVLSYNSAIGSLESNFFPAARKFKELAVPTGEDIAILGPIEVEARPLIARDWKGPESGDVDRASVDRQLPDSA